MPGGKRTRSKTAGGGKASKHAKLEGENPDMFDMDGLTPGDESKQTKTQRVKKDKGNKPFISTTAQVVEEDQILEIETTGQMTEFQSETEEGEEVTDSELGSDSFKRSENTRVRCIDHEVSFVYQINIVEQSSEEEDVE